VGSNKPERGTCCYRHLRGRREISRRLVDALPQLVVLRDGEWTVGDPLIAAEIGKDDFGQEAVLDRLLDLLVVAVLRAWFARPERAPRVGTARTPTRSPDRRCDCCTTNPAHPWTVGSLARGGVSPRALARRFAELVGEPPMAFLNRLAARLAADLLLDPDATVGAVARQVGYTARSRGSARRSSGATGRARRPTAAMPRWQRASYSRVGRPGRPASPTRAILHRVEQRTAGT